MTCKITIKNCVLYCSKLVVCQFFLSVLYLSAYQALVIDPIADLFGAPLKTDGYPYTELLRENLQKTPCYRLHQLLFHEQVEVLEEYGDHVRVELPDAFYIPALRLTEKVAIFWMRKDSLIPCADLSLHDRFLLPAMRSFSSELFCEKSGTSQKNVCLIKPWYDKKSDRFFSSGTRFMCLASRNKEATPYLAVYIFDPLRKRMIVRDIPRSHVLDLDMHKHMSSRDLFIMVLRLWAQRKDAIPYVWGGVSELEEGAAARGYQGPYAGFDCTGLIWRAAQCVQVPYFYKNTTTIAHCMAEVQTQIKKGDIIWYPGHALVVSDVDKNCIIEARSSVGGYACVHEIPLSRVFKNIHTFDDLIHARDNRLSLSLLDCAQKEMKLCPRFKIFSMQQFLGN